MTLKSPYVYFGGKSKIIPAVWDRPGDVRNAVDPFWGSGAFLLGRPEKHTGKIETVNDIDGMIANFWRAVTAVPDEVAFHADNPVNENDLHARHVWLVNQRKDLHTKLEGDPFYYDARIAGWWVWGIACWIGSGFCSGNGAWSSVDGELVKVGKHGVTRKRPHLGNAGKGINRKRPQLGNGGASGQGVNAVADLPSYMRQLQRRMRRVRVASGDWKRVTGKSVTYGLGLTGVFLDPPYAASANRASDLYAFDDESVAHEVRKWALENGDNPKMRIAICGYDIEHGEYMPPEWEVLEWKTGGGYDVQAKNGRSDNHKRERIWFSPHCLNVEPSGQMGLL